MRVISRVTTFLGTTIKRRETASSSCLRASTTENSTLPLFQRRTFLLVHHGAAGGAGRGAADHQAIAHLDHRRAARQPCGEEGRWCSLTSAPGGFSQRHIKQQAAPGSGQPRLGRENRWLACSWHAAFGQFLSLGSAWQASASWRSGGSSQRHSMHQAASGSSRPRPNGLAGPAASSLGL